MGDEEARSRSVPGQRVSYKSIHDLIETLGGYAVNVNSKEIRIEDAGLRFYVSDDGERVVVEPLEEPPDFTP